MRPTEPQPRFVVCVKNKDYPASLELRKLYQVVADPAAAKHYQLRVIDESGEDYLYPEEYFVSVSVAAGFTPIHAVEGNLGDITAPSQSISSDRNFRGYKYSLFRRLPVTNRHLSSWREMTYET